MDDKICTFHLHNYDVYFTFSLSFCSLYSATHSALVFYGQLFSRYRIWFQFFQPRSFSFKIIVIKKVDIANSSCFWVEIILPPAFLNPKVLKVRILRKFVKFYFRNATWSSANSHRTNTRHFYSLTISIYRRLNFLIAHLGYLKKSKWVFSGKFLCWVKLVTRWATR